eukprot:6111369-Pleurochrysis_carterae.AAC.2
MKEVAAASRYLRISFDMPFLGLSSAALLLLLPSVVAQCSFSDAWPSEWVDPDTPPEKCTIRSHRDGVEHILVFSDEFETDGRTFFNGDDSKWSAIDLPPSTNKQVAEKTRTLQLGSASL